MPGRSSSTIDNLCDSIATTIADYRKGDIQVPTQKHVLRWLKQFSERRQERVAIETDRVLSQTYYSKQLVKAYLGALVEKKEFLDGEKPAKFWKKVNFVRTQALTKSQSDLLRILGGILKKKFGFSSHECGSKTGIYLHLDDFIFTGNTVRRDVANWLIAVQPKSPKLAVVVLGCHHYGSYYAEKEITKLVEAAKGQTSFWQARVFEDRKSSPDSCDVLRPRRVPATRAAKAYLSELEYEPALRGDTTTSAIYKSEIGRRVLEAEFLRIGFKIRGFCEKPERAMRPLGFSTLDGFGCGAVAVTYRNCPNTSPLAWWWGDAEAPSTNPLSKWYPLFPRKYNIS